MKHYINELYKFIALVDEYNKSNERYNIQVEINKLCRYHGFIYTLEPTTEDIKLIGVEL